MYLIIQMAYQDNELLRWGTALSRSFCPKPLVFLDKSLVWFFLINFSCFATLMSYGKRTSIYNHVPKIGSVGCTIQVLGCYYMPTAGVGGGVYYE